MQEPSLLEAYNKYLDFELLEGDPARIQCLFERALQENCLQPDLWLRYTKYLVRSVETSWVKEYDKVFIAIWIFNSHYAKKPDSTISYSSL